MTKNTFIKEIWISFKYGLSNKKGGFWGVIFLLYTAIWILFAPFIIYFSINYFLNGVIDVSLFSTLIIVLILAPYLPIYFAWELNDKKQNKELIQINTQKPLNKTKGIKSAEASHKTPNFSQQTNKYIKYMDRILQNENVLDAISGKKKTDKESDMSTSALVLTSTKIIFYQKKLLGRYQFKDYPINSINSISFNSGLFYDGIKLYTKIGDLEFGNISKKDRTEDFVNNVKSCMSTSKSIPSTQVKAQTFKSIYRETEFYQGFIRLKMAITNTTVLVINDVALDFYFDEVLLRKDRHEPDYPIKNGKIILGNINSGSSKSVAIYFDPLMCSKGTEIKCLMNYSDVKGQIQTTWMKPKSISVVCPIMKTDSDINIGRLKEFVEKLLHSDSKIYQIQTGFDIDSLKTISREVIQKHDVKHIRSLYTKDGKTCEMWYYGNTKVNNHNIVIMITISSENKSIELFAATQTAESLTGLLAELGRELFTSIEDKITGKNNVNQVINVSIEDSIIQRSNLLSYCDIDGKCIGDVVVEDSIMRRSDIGLNAKDNDSYIQKTDVSGSSCPVCSGAVPDGAKFCNECGGKLK
ncbi:MAG: PH domain-containing protein [Methanosarcinales archaeon]|nr:PH domain-containing protein [Methanosarcinales archaeon]